MRIAIAVAAAALLWAGYAAWRASSRLRRLHGRLEEAWRAVETALAARDRALKEFVLVLASLGLVPEGRRALEVELPQTARAVTRGPRELALADERLKIALRAVYGGLPRARPPALRRAQNGLAEAEDELDLARRRYNELVVDWNQLLSRWTYRRLAERRGLGRREPYLLPGEEEEFIRQRGPSF